LRTLSISPCGDDTVSTISNWSAWNTDRLYMVIEREWTRKAYYGDVPVSTVWRVSFVQYHRNASERLTTIVLITAQW